MTSRQGVHRATCPKLFTDLSTKLNAAFLAADHYTSAGAMCSRATALLTIAFTSRAVPSGSVYRDRTTPNGALGPYHFSMKQALLDKIFTNSICSSLQNASSGSRTSLL
jgi:hypothetical protein